jgi:hypothetical protein
VSFLLREKRLLVYRRVNIRATLTAAFSGSPPKRSSNATGGGAGASSVWSAPGGEGALGRSMSPLAAVSARQNRLSASQRELSVPSACLTYPKRNAYRFNTCARRPVVFCRALCAQTECVVNFATPPRCADNVFTKYKVFEEPVKLNGLKMMDI